MCGDALGNRDRANLEWHLEVVMVQLEGRNLESSEIPLEAVIEGV
jgi:hypothetical protein